MPIANILGNITPAATNGVHTAPVAWAGRFTSSTPGYVNGLRYYVAQAALGDGRVTETRIRLFDSTGGVDNVAYEMVNKVVTIAPTVGWQEWSFDTPVAILANHVYGFSINHVSATASILYGYTTGVSVPIVNDGLTLEFIGYRDAGLHAGYPGGASGTTNFLVDVIVNVPDPVTVDVGADQEMLSTDPPLALTATAVGSGTITYAWTKVSGPFGSFSSTTAASTTFTPGGGDGTYVLRCTVNDLYTTSYDEVTVVVIDPIKHSFPTSVVLDSGWTYTGGAGAAVFGDENGATFATSMNNPLVSPLTVLMGTIDPPGPTIPLRLRLGIDVINAPTGSVVARLYEGSTLRSSVGPVTLENTGHSLVEPLIELSFPASDLTSIANWSNLRVRLEVTA